MRPNSKQLALRDPAMASILGVVGQDDFGGEYGDFDDFGLDDEAFGFEFGADAPAGGAMSAAQVQSLVRKAVQGEQITASRTRLISPNKGSNIKIQRYSFNLNAALVLGTAGAFSGTSAPDTELRPQRITMNAPSYGFATIENLKVANVSVIVGGVADAFQYNPNAVGQSLDLPTLSPANRATVSGTYSGYVPPGFVAAAPYTFCVSLTGPATIVA
jgi:hypothetical protein